MPLCEQVNVTVPKGVLSEARAIARGKGYSFSFFVTQALRAANANEKTVEG